MVEDLTDFIVKYSIHKDREVIKKYIQEHLLYKTCDYALDKNGEIIFFCRYNVNGETAHVLDLIVHPKYRRKRIIKWVILRNIVKFPFVKFLRWERESKYPERDKRIYAIKEIIKEV